MFYNNRKTIYISLIIIALIFSFMAGKRIGTGTLSNKETTKATVENTNYDNTLSVKGNNYSLDYSIINAMFLDKTSMQFNVNSQGNTNVSTIKVVAKDQDNNNLEVDPTASADSNALGYIVKLDTNTTKVSVNVYPLTKVMASNNKLDLTTIPFKTSELDVSLLKQEQIQNLQN